LPPKFDVYQVRDTLVLGHWTNADDIEHIRLLRVTRPRGTPPSPAASPVRATYDQSAELEQHRAFVTRMQAAMRLLFNAQEMYFESHLRYAASVEDLPRKARPTEFTATLLDVQRNSYAMVFSHNAMRVSCAMALGRVSRAGELIVCG
jgi:hypothetical protein